MDQAEHEKSMELMELGANDVSYEDGSCYPANSASTPVKRASNIDVESLRKGVAAVSFVESPRSRSGSKSVKARRNLFMNKKPSQPQWTLDETKGLVYFLMLHMNGKSWSVHKDFRFWDIAGTFIQFRVHSAIRYLCIHEYFSAKITCNYLCNRSQW